MRTGRLGRNPEGIEMSKTKIPYYVYLSLRKAGDQIKMSVPQLLELNRLAAADGLELDLTPATGPAAAETIHTPADVYYTDRQARESLAAWIKRLPSGTQFSRDEAIRKALLTEPRDRFLTDHPSCAGALVFVTRAIRKVQGVIMTTNENGASAFSDPVFTFMKAI